jgi:peptidoglycan/LPS O-acetylase OafA/YrhL
MSGVRSNDDIAAGVTAEAMRFSPAQSDHLDTLRGVAAQMVLFHHAMGASFPDSGYGNWGIGNIGVLVFFLLSGFLITHSIANRIAAQHFSFGEFAVSRFSRIYTAYLPAVIFVALIDQISLRFPAYPYRGDYNFGTAVANLAMLQDFPLFQILRRLHVSEQTWFVTSFGSGKQFWTISIEWWIYMSVGLFMGMLVRRGRVSGAFLALLALASIETAYNFVGGPGDSLTADWLLGALACLACRRALRDGVLRPASNVTICALWIVVAILTATRVFYTHNRFYDPVFVSLLGGMMFLPLLLRRRRGNVGLWRRTGLPLLSFHSYSLYLTHNSLLVLLSLAAPLWIRSWEGLAASVLLSNVVAVAFAVLFERHHMAVRAVMLRALVALRARAAKAPGGARVFPLHR